MANAGRIPIPLSQRWRRFRIRILPLMIFVVTGAGSYWVWSGVIANPTMVGAANSVVIEPAAIAGGNLLPLAAGELNQFDTVQAGQVVARLDDTITTAMIDTLRADQVTLKAQLEAAEEEAIRDTTVAKVDILRGALDMAFDVERRKLDIFDRQTRIEAARIARDRLDERIAALQILQRDGSQVRQQDLDEAVRERDIQDQLFKSENTALKIAEEQLAVAQKRMDENKFDQLHDLEKLIAPVRAEIAAQDARIKELQVQAEALTIRSTVTGKIREVYKRPGQVVTAGEPILSIVLDKPQFIVTYIRQGRGPAVKAAVNMPVEIRTQSGQVATSKVEYIGPQYELVPPQQNMTRDMNLIDYGLPVRIALPPELAVTPGELVHLRLVPNWEAVARANGLRPRDETATTSAAGR